MRLGIMGGTFDPIHYGHLYVAENARLQYQLDLTLFVPNRIPAHKKAYAVSSAEHRFAMTRLAIADNPCFQPSRIELDRPGPSYTVDTLRLLRQAYPMAELFFITGLDAVIEIATWRRHEEVLQLCTFIAAPRPGLSAQTIHERLPPNALARVALLEGHHLAISSTDIRDSVRRGLSIRYLTPDPVVEYIRHNRLYRPEPP
jgi:nicotinate-nucleotide adenylyltransferase